MSEDRKQRYNLAVYNSPQYKMGIKVMDWQQLQNVFPQHRNILESIENYRQSINMEMIRSMDQQDNIMFDNVFSIMGKRGSGKTSVLYTLKKMIERDHPHDVVLPVVMPELIPHSSEMIEWILALFEEKISEISERLSTKEEKESLFFRDCHVSRQEDLVRKYHSLKMLCSSTSQKQNIGTFSEKASWQEKFTQDRFNLSQELVKFWTMLKDSIIRSEGVPGGTVPLIYVLFDDVDMAPERIWEMMSIIVKYLAHPNVIVILTAEEEMLYHVVRNILNSKVKRLASEDHYLEEITRRYVGKILPPATRYYIENFEACLQKKKFIVELKFNKQCEVEARIGLQKYIEFYLDRYLEKIPGEKVENDFLHYKDHFVDIYLIFWGNTARQLGNSCLIFRELISDLMQLKMNDNRKDNKIQNLEEKERYLQNLFQIIYQFTFKILSTNSNIWNTYGDMKTLVDELIVYHPKEWGVYLNYVYLYNHTMKIRGEKEVEERFIYPFVTKEQDNSQRNLISVVKESITLYILLYFLENILMLEGKRRRDVFPRGRSSIHGQLSLVSLLDQITSSGRTGKINISLVRRNVDGKNMAAFLYSYGKLLEHPEMLMDFDLANPIKVREYFYSLNKEEDATEELSEYNKNNPVWFKNIVQLLFLAKEGFYDIPKKELFRGDFGEEFRLFDRGLNNLLRKSIENMQEELLSMGERMQEEFDMVCYRYADSKWIDEELKENQIATIEEIDELVEKKIASIIKADKRKIRVKKVVYRQKGIKRYNRLLCIQNYLSMAGEFESTDSNRRGMIEKIRENIKQNSWGTLKLYLQETIANLRKEFVRYQIKDIVLFKDYVQQMQEKQGIRFDLDLIEEEQWISIKYMNAIMRTILRETYNKRLGEADQDGDLEISREIYRGFTNLLNVDIRKKNKEAVRMVLYQKIYDFVEIEALNESLEKRRKEGTSVAIDYSQIPYKQFYKKIREALSLALNGEKISIESGSEKSMISYLIEGYVRSAIGMYLESI